MPDIFVGSDFRLHVEFVLILWLIYSLNTHHKATRPNPFPFILHIALQAISWLIHASHLLQEVRLLNVININLPREEAMNLKLLIK